MARYVHTLTYFAGQVLPLAAVAKTLPVRRYETAFYNLDQVAPLLEREGFLVRPFEQAAENLICDAMSASEARDPVRCSAPPTPTHTLRDCIADTMPQQFADLLEHLVIPAVVARTTAC
jgi:hypothetical protein